MINMISLTWAPGVKPRALLKHEQDTNLLTGSLDAAIRSLEDCESFGMQAAEVSGPMDLKLHCKRKRHAVSGGEQCGTTCQDVPNDKKPCRKL